MTLRLYSSVQVCRCAVLGELVLIEAAISPLAVRRSSTAFHPKRTENFAEGGAIFCPFRFPAKAIDAPHARRSIVLYQDNAASKPRIITGGF